MAFRKCPRCELNYITDEEQLCSVCRREVKGETDRDASVEMCSSCGERPAVPGSEYCLLCLKELGQNNKPSDDTNAEETHVDPSSLDIGMVSGMDEIQIDNINDLNGDIPQSEFDEMKSAFGDDESDIDDAEEVDETAL